MPESAPAPFRCSAASLFDREQMAGTAPQESAFLCLEYAGPWGHQALAESRLPESVRDGLADVPGVKVLLIRRHGGFAGPGVRVFAAWVGAEPWIETTVLDRPEEVLELDLAGLGEGRRPGLEEYDDLLWLVCTNGRRDRCCAEIGRPIVAAVGARWPHQTWETTHLGGHRFAGTLLALPSGACLGRLDDASAVAACLDVEAGRHPVDHSRGRAGLPPAAQVAELAVLEEAPATALGDLHVDGAAEPTVRGTVGQRAWSVDVTEEPGPERRQSCGDTKVKAVVVRRPGPVSWTDARV